MASRSFEPATSNRGLPTVKIEPAGKFSGPDWGELWQYRSLFGFLVWRDIKIRYAQTFLGVAWALVQPLLTMAIFTVIFGRIAGISPAGAPYWAFALAGLTPWFYFSTSLTGASLSLVSNSNFLTKIYFPRLAIPFAPVLAGLLDLTVSTVVVVLALSFFHRPPQFPNVLWIPVFALVAIAAAAGIGFFLAAVNVKYRDIKYVVPFLVQILMYVSPVVYPATAVPEKWRLLYCLNPMAGVVEGFRYALLGSTVFGWPHFLTSGAVACLLFVLGVLYLRSSEDQFADLV